MNKKIMTSVGCLLMLAAAIAPSVLGHSERPANELTDYQPPYGNDVSGFYVGAAGPAIAIEAYDDTSPFYNNFAAGSILCDAEVILDDPTFPGNEETIDGNAGNGATHDGAAPDTVDDGGQGGACHSTSYATDEFNTADCFVGDTQLTYNGVADVWTGVTCDWKTDEGGTSNGDKLELCVVNSILQTDVDELVDCVMRFVDCLTNPTCGPDDALQSCGADHVADAIDFGYGSGAFNAAVFPGNTGITNGDPAVTGACPDGPAAVFVFDAVATNGGGLTEDGPLPDPDGDGPLPDPDAPTYVPGDVDVYPAGAGDTWR